MVLCATCIQVSCIKFLVRVSRRKLGPPAIGLSINHTPATLAV